MAGDDSVNYKLSFVVRIHSVHSESVSTMSIIKMFDPEPLTTGLISKPFFLSMIWTNTIIGLFTELFFFTMFGKQVGCLVDPLTYKQEILKLHAINTLPQSGVLKYVAKMHNGGARDDF